MRISFNSRFPHRGLPYKQLGLTSVFGGALVTLLLMCGGTAYAAYVVGPTGTLVNGWYKGYPTIQVYPDNYTGGCSIHVLSDPMVSFLEGSHIYTVKEASDGAIYTQVDGGHLDMVDGGCAKDDAASATTVWSATVKVDTSPPALSVSTPINNTNTTSSSITVSGSVADADSGVASVTVNSIAAAVIGNSFSATIPLTVGLNSINVAAFDSVGYTTTLPTLTVLRMQPSASVVPSASSSTPASASVNTTSASSNSAPSQESYTAPKSSTNTAQSPSTPKASEKLSASPVPTQNLTAKNVGNNLTQLSTVEVGAIVTVCLVGLILAHRFGLVSFRRIGRIVKPGKNRD